VRLQQHKFLSLKWHLQVFIVFRHLTSHNGDSSFLHLVSFNSKKFKTSIQVIIFNLIMENIRHWEEILNLKRCQKYKREKADPGIHRNLRFPLCKSIIAFTSCAIHRYITFENLKIVLVRLWTVSTEFLGATGEKQYESSVICN